MQTVRGDSTVYRYGFFYGYFFGRFFGYVVT